MTVEPELWKTAPPIDEETPDRLLFPPKRVPHPAKTSAVVSSK